jgi:hypothetical protein
MKMKWTSYLLSAVASAVLTVAFASGAHAQWQDADFNKFLGNHPGVASQLRANPSLINDPAFRQAHPDLQQYLQNHQRVSEMVRSQAAGMGGHGYYPGHNYPGYAGNPGYNAANGAWDEHHEWRDRQWWLKHNPDWVKSNHPEWWANHH